MTHEIYDFTDNILTFGFTGTINQEAIELFAEATIPYFEQGTKEKPIHFLVDTESDDGMSLYARRWFTQLNKDERLDKVALVGGSSRTKVIASFILRATGRNNLRFFPTFEEGRQWILDGS